MATHRRSIPLSPILTTGRVGATPPRPAFLKLNHSFVIYARPIALLGGVGLMASAVPLWMLLYSPQCATSDPAILASTEVGFDRAADKLTVTRGSHSAGLLIPSGIRCIQKSE